MMHWLLRPRRHGHLQHPHKRVFKQNAVTLRRSLHRVETIGEGRLVLPQKMGTPRKENEDTQQKDQRGKATAVRTEEVCSMHGLKYGAECFVVFFRFCV